MIEKTSEVSGNLTPREVGEPPLSEGTRASCCCCQSEAGEPFLEEQDQAERNGRALILGTPFPLEDMRVLHA